MKNNHYKGLILGLAGVLLLVPDGLLIRLTPVSAETFLATRGLFGAAGMVAMSLLFGTIRWPRGAAAAGAIIYSLLFGLGAVMFIRSIMATEVANTLVIISATPLIAAIMTTVFLHERIPLYTWIATSSALVAIALVFLAAPGPGFANGLQGQLYALGSVLVVSTTFIIIRKFAAVDIIAGAALGLLCIGLAHLPFADFSNLSLQSWLLLVLAGILPQGVAFWFINQSARLLPPPEVGLLFMLELGFGPVLLWLVVGEQPSPITITAGVLMLVVFTGYAYFSLRAQSKAKSMAVV